MGLRTLLKGLRTSNRKKPSPSPSTEGADTNNRCLTPTTTKSHTLQPGVPDSGITLTSKNDNTPRDLWDEAYAALGREDPILKQRYEEILLTHDGANGESSQTHLAAAGSYQREEQLRQIAKNKVEEIDLAQWQLQIGSHSVDVGGQFDKVVKIVVTVKDFISSAVISEPHAAMAWAGVCIFLPLLLNPTEQKSAARDGLQAIPFTVHRLRVMERLIKPGHPGATESIYHADSLQLVNDFINHAVELYKTILEFQMRFVKQHSDSWAKRYGREVLKADDWTSLTSQIKTLEARCTEIAQDLSREKIESALQESDRNMQSGLQRIQEELEKTRRDIEKQTMMQSVWRQTDEERNCVQLFRQSNPYEDQKNRTPRRVLETGKWFLEHKKFVDWRENEGSDLLWLSAKPGSGKSVLSRALIDEDLITLGHQKQTAVCYFFFKDISPYQRSALSAMAAILHQLFSAFPCLVKHAIIPYGLNGRDLLSLFDEMFDILCQAAADPAVGQVVCLLDALDECNDETQFTLIETITSFYHKSKDASISENEPKLKFLLTSRPYSSIHSQFHDLMEETPTIHLSGDHESEKIKNEINHVIDVEIPELAAKKGFDEEATKYLLDELHSVDNRTYLWLKLITEEIRLSERPANKREVRKIISDLPRSLLDAFYAILKRCRNAELARQLLHIILAAREPLTVDDMKIATALAGDLEYSSYAEIGAERSDIFEMRIKNICGLMVTIEGGRVFLIHQTAKEFLIHQDDTAQRSELWRHSFRPTDSETLIATICIALLSFKCFAETPLTIEDEDSDQARKKIFDYTNDHAFLGYAAMNWMAHALQSKLDDDPKWTTAMSILCSVHKPVCRTWYTIYQGSDKTRLPRHITSLNLAAELQFTNVLASLLEGGEDPNEPDGHGATPLARSVQKSKRAVELLLNANADINAQGWDEPWYDDVDEGGSEIEIKPFSGTPLTMAVLFKDVEMVRYLIDRGAAINFPLRASTTPLLAAILICCYNGSESTEICELLLSRGANVSFQHHVGESVTTALHDVAEQNIPSLLRMFLQSETANVNLQTSAVEDDDQVEGQDATETQVRVETPEFVSSERSLSMDRSYSERKTSPGERYRNEDTERDSETDERATMLTDDNADNNSSPEFDDDDNASDSYGASDSPSTLAKVIGVTPLHLAIRGELVENVKILLEHGADMHIEDSRGWTAMQYALKLPGEDEDDDDSDSDSASESETEGTVKAQIIRLLKQYDPSCFDGLLSHTARTSSISESGAVE
ncbi:uncharacterized protein BDV17DRAFT_264963 [Aspergillus undulatus]|uniref:uncharacterized protein n=1 Tax=Aspergillus undulatus TaxID=1810928 RepID=UPI003CCE1B36